MAEIYIPIDFSKIRRVIPSGEDILYSTLCKMTINHGMQGRYLINETTWTAHVLMTQSGFAMSIPQENQVTEKKFIPWYEIKYLYPTGIFWGLRTKRLEFIRGSIFESKESFKKRKWEFPVKFIPFVIESYKNRMEANPTKFKSRTIRKMKSRINNLEIDLEKFRIKASKKIAKMNRRDL